MGVKLAPPLSRSPAPHACPGYERDTLRGGQIVFDILSRSSLDRLSIDSVDLSSGWLCETSHARTMTMCLPHERVRKGRGMMKLEDVGKETSQMDPRIGKLTY